MINDNIQVLKIGKLSEALCSAQSKMTGARKDSKNPFYKSSYASLSSVFEAIREPFSENGLSISQTMDVLENGRTVMNTLLLHKSGEFLKSSMILPDIADPQKLGGAITYFRRYSLLAISGIPAEDDDGNEATGYVKAKKLKAKAKIQPLDDKPRIGITKAIELEKRLKEHTEYHMTIEDFLKKNKITLSGLDKEFGERIETKLNMLDQVAIEELREAHG